MQEYTQEKCRERSISEKRRTNEKIAKEDTGFFEGRRWNQHGGNHTDHCGADWARDYLQESADKSGVQYSEQDYE